MAEAVDRHLQPKLKESCHEERSADRAGRGRFGLGVLAYLVDWFVSVNNRFVALQENVHSAWGQVETVLQRRYDLIPNLVNTVKGYAKHEKDVLEEVTRLRSQWGAQDRG